MALSPTPDASDARAQPPMLPPPRPRTLVGSARSMVGRLASPVHGPDAVTARRNAWEAVCVDRERRRQWNETIEPPRGRQVTRPRPAR